MAVTYMTEEGYKKLIDQIKQLESVERPRISAQIAEARDKGDLSENAEYDAAKEAQGLLEMKIAQLKDTLANARILDESMVSADSIQILSKVRVKDQKTGREMNYMLVSFIKKFFKIFNNRAEWRGGGFYAFVCSHSLLKLILINSYAI